MRVLLSAYACEPGKGSEPGVGWHWSRELARLGHEVAVITRSNNRIAIEESLAKEPIAALQFHYYDLPSWARWWKRGSRGVELYYLLWQHGAYCLARQLAHKTQFDLVHHLTFGMFRHPSFMGRLGLPFVIGPLGGGEATPALLRRSFRSTDAFKDAARGILNKLALWNPSVSAMFKQADLILCKTQETLAVVPASCREKGCVHLEVGVDSVRVGQEIASKVGSAEFLYAGRLVYWKGLHLALKALSELKKDRPDATLAVIGTGPDEARLKRLSAALGLQDSVRWSGWIPQEELWAQYGHYTAFVFPSLHDSSGNVVLEAMSQGLPVVCLDTGGPRAIVPSTCGIRVPVENRREAEVVEDLAAAMRMLVDNPEFRGQMAVRALDFAKASTWKDVVSSAYQHVEDVLAGSRRSAGDRTD
jgi:glycosyltransferase involved in cell wall biosynthesis